MLLLVVLLFFTIVYKLLEPDFYNAENTRKYGKKKPPQNPERGVHMEWSHGGIHPDID